MGYALVWLNADGTKLYSTNTNIVDSFSKNIDHCAEIVQQKNAENAARSLVKHGLYDKMPSGGKLYVSKVERMALPLTEIKPIEKTTGYIVSSEHNGITYFYRGAKNPKWFRSRLFDTDGTLITVFKTQKEAEKLIVALTAAYKQDVEDEEKNRNRRNYNYWGNTSNDYVNPYQEQYDIALNAKVIFRK